MLISSTTKCAICGRIILDHSKSNMTVHIGRAFHRICLIRHPVDDPSLLPVWPRTRVGYFREFTKKPANSWLSECVAAHASEHEDRVVDYLRNGIVLVPSSNAVTDPIDKTKPVIGTGSILTDEIWDWPDYLAVLVLKYHVQLDRAFIEHMARQNWKVQSHG